jgi:crossover junction endodeoxyribonuclease RusA
VTLELPYPPTTNHAYTVARGRKIKTAAARAYANDVQIACIEQLAATQARRWTRATRFAATVTVSAPDKRRRDLANTEKLAIDAVFDWLDFDDSQIDRLTIERGAVDRERPRLVLTLEVL